MCFESAKEFMFFKYKFTLKMLLIVLHEALYKD